MTGLLALMSGKLSVREGMDNGALRVEGDVSAAEAIESFFTTGRN